MSDIGVSIICNTYNQEKYIRDALDSFLMQKTTFKYEILVHDDASTDNTAEIVKEYEVKYPDIVKPIYQKENQYSQNKSISLTYQYPRARGKYCAFCEGDDYWTDPLKLQKQYDILEAHPEIDICTHGAISVNANTKKQVGSITPSKESRLMPLEEVIMGEGGYTAANSIFFRSSVNDNIPEFRDCFRYQYTLKIHASIRGGMYYIADVMSAYRVLAEGSWTKNMAENKHKWTVFHEQKRKMLALLDKYTDYNYSDVIRERGEKNEFLLLLQTEQYKEMFDKKYRKFLGKLPWKMKTYAIVKTYFPWSIKLIKFFRKR